MNRDHHRLWEIANGETRTSCVMVSCCSGAELQILRTTHGDEQILMRELYPDRDSLYERARELEAEINADQASVVGRQSSGSVVNPQG
jgi:hypothetical protein